MKFGVLADYFEGAGAKVLTQVEVSIKHSHQHEFQGVSAFRAFLGTAADKQTFPTTFCWLDDTEEREPISLQSFCTWSDVRRGKPGRSQEFHLYYATEAEPVVHRARAGDQLIIARGKDGSLMALITPDGSTIGQQLLWLFGLDLLDDRSIARRIERGDAQELGFAARAVLADLGIEVDEPEPDTFHSLVETFGLQFPGTVQLSSFTRDSLPDVDPMSDPDGALVTWMEQEEALFRYLERNIVSERLRRGFMSGHHADVDGFLSFSLSVQNRRKSRAGLAFGHHVEALLQAHNIGYTREATTEKRNAADFLFPGDREYADSGYPADRLAMLAVKTTCKDRWRQVLAEADRIQTKHLLTLEPAISGIQTAEMQGHGLRLVLPASLHTSYRPDQRAWLMNVREFIDLVREFRPRQQLLI